MIGIFDSGIGGLTVLKSIHELMPEYQYIYLGDNLRNPYGNHNKETLIQYAREAVNELFNRGAKLIVFACFTACSTTLREMQQEFLAESKDRKILGILRPVAEQAATITRNKRIGVIGTRATISSQAFEKEIKKIDPEIELVTKACPLLVPLIEENWDQKPETRKIIKRYVNPLKDHNIDSLILGCTHYPVVKDAILDIVGKSIEVPSVSNMVANSLKDYLSRHPEIDNQLNKKSGSITFYCTENKESFNDACHRIQSNPTIEKIVLG